MVPGFTIFKTMPDNVICAGVATDADFTTGGVGVGGFGVGVGGFGVGVGGFGVGVGGFGVGVGGFGVGVGGFGVASAIAFALCSGVIFDNLICSAENLVAQPG